MSSRAPLVALVALAACTAAAPPEASQPGPAFDPVAFFTGPTHGDGRLRQIFKSEKTVTVDSVGKRGTGGWLTLRQHVMTQGEAPRNRVWRLRQVAPGSYAGTLTDATGPVETVAVGRAIRIRYPIKDGLRIEQWLVPLPDGRALNNHLSVTKLGIEVASLRERITKR